MKNIVIIALALCSFQLVNAQEKNNKKITESSFKVDGVCEMCKERIENAALRTSGVKLANWDVKTHELKVVYKTSKTDEEAIQKSISEVGHDTEKHTADSAAYMSIHPCCRYRDDKVIDDHK